MAFVYFTEEQKRQANSVNLEDFLIRQGEKLLKSGRESRMESNHSVTIHGNRWYDHAEEEGGFAIDFVQKYYEKTFPEAVSMLLDGAQGQSYQQYHKPEKEEEKKPFVLPEKNQNMRRIYAYLTKTRGIDRDVLSVFVHAKLIYEDAKYHNAVFVGTDADGNPCHAHKRGTSTTESYKGNVESSNPKYSFHWLGQSDTLYVFEAPIDLLSFITLYQKDWELHSYVALCGTTDQPILQLLEDEPRIKKVALCLDRDAAGIKAGARIRQTLLERGCQEVFPLFPTRKDWNEDLQAFMRGQNISHERSCQC